MLNFLFGISLAINIILILAIYLYFKFKKGVSELNEIIEDKEVFKDFFGNNM